jgi:hypothetical protein
MAIDILGSEEFTDRTGTLTIPQGCGCVLAFVVGTVSPVKIDGIAANGASIVEASAIVPAIGISVRRQLTGGEHDFEIAGTAVTFVYLNAGSLRKGGLSAGYAEAGTFEGSIASDEDDWIFAMCLGTIGPTALECDEVEMTYIKDSTLLKIGYVAAGAAILACLASDSGTSEGYWADGGSYWVPQSYTPGWWEYRTVWVPGHWTYNNPLWVPAHWEGGVGHVWVPGHFEYVDIWVPGFYQTEPYQYHEAVTVPGHWEDFPDVWVPAGNAQISAAFCSIREFAEVGFVSRPIIFG